MSGSNLLPDAPTLGLTDSETFAQTPHTELKRKSKSNLTKVGDFWVRKFHFETRRLGEALDAPPRTVGQTCMIVESPPHIAIGEAEAVAVCLGGPDEAAAAGAAKEKVVFCNQAGETSVYQADRSNRSAALCACGNATGAAAAMLAQIDPRAEVQQLVTLPDGKVEVCGDVRPVSEDSWHVEQSWRGVQYQAVRTKLADRDVVICTGTLNDYVIVRMEDEVSLDRFNLDDAQGLWREARPYGFANPLQSRLVAVAPGGARPAARFYTCGRAHPGAPLTGLATLALARNHADWLACMLKDGAIAHPRGVDALPIMRDEGIQFCPIQVRICSA